MDIQTVLTFVAPVVLVMAGWYGGYLETRRRYNRVIDVLREEHAKDTTKQIKVQEKREASLRDALTKARANEAEYKRKYEAISEDAARFRHVSEATQQLKQSTIGLAGTMAAIFGKHT